MQLHQKRPVKCAGEAGIALRAKRCDSIYFCASVRVVVGRFAFGSGDEVCEGLRGVCGVWCAL